MDSQQLGLGDEDGSPTPEGSTEMVSTKNVKSDRSRRNWSLREEEILMATMKELTANGWRGDNGYRAGYLVRIKEAIKREFPNTDICPHPHIYSKITTWKRHYGSLMNMLKLSGVGFNDYKIECDDEQLAHIVKKDPHAKYMRNKSWPQLEEWKEIFGNDRAGGVRTMDVGDAVGKIYGTTQSPAEDVGTSHPMTFDELFPDEVFPDGFLPEMIDESQPVPEGSGATAGAGAGAGGSSGVGTGAGNGEAGGSGGVAGAATVSGCGSGSRAVGKMATKALKKRKIEDKMDGVLHLMSQIHTDTNERLKEISSRIGYDFDLSTKRSEVFDQLKGIPGLTLKQQFYISKKLVKEPELMDLFRGLPEAARAAFVWDLLESDGTL